MLNHFKQKKKKSFANRINKILNLSICISAIYLLLTYIKSKNYISRAYRISQSPTNKMFYKPSVNQKGKSLFSGETQMNTDSNYKKIQYTQEELNEAISELNLPTWSRSYRHCSSSESEVSCYEIIKAWRLIKSWIHSVQTTPIDDRRVILIQHFFDGVGNRISIDAVGFLLALMDNRSLIIKGFYLKNGQPNYDKSNAYIFNPKINFY